MFCRRALGLVTFLSQIALFAPLALMLPRAAEACSIAPIMVYPTCAVPAPRPDERVTAIYSERGQALSSVTVGGDAMLTEVVEVEVEAADRPHYIALSSGGPIIWRFTGQTALISRVVVFGSQHLGFEKNGIAGVSKERVLFIPADVDALKSAPQTSCHASVSACELSTYFGIPRLTNRMQLGPVARWNTRPEQAAKIAEDKRKSAEAFHISLELASIAFPARDELEAGPYLPDLFPTDQHLRYWRASKVRVPADGNVDAGQAPYVSPDVLNSSHEGGLIQIDPADVVSPSKVTAY